LGFWWVGGGGGGVPPPPTPPTPQSPIPNPHNIMLYLNRILKLKKIIILK